MAEDPKTAGEASNVDVVRAHADAPIVLPSDDALLSADFVRAGDDLRLETPDGRVTIIEDYFNGAEPRDLMIAGAVVPGRVVGKLARKTDPEAEAAEQEVARAPEADDRGAAPEAPAAQSETDAPSPAHAAAAPAGPPIATVAETSGGAFVTRGGQTLELKPGDPVYEDDVLTTDAEGAVGVVFVDGMSFSLSKGGRMVLDEFAYSPETETGGGLFSVVQGAFSFVSGKAAHTAPDALLIDTPTMTIGVRGTKVVAEIAADGSATKVALLAEEDGTVGKIMVSTDAGEELISDANRMVEVSDRSSPPSAQRAVSSNDMVDGLGDALNVLPAPTTLFSPTVDSGADGGGAYWSEAAAVERAQEAAPAESAPEANAAQVETAVAAAAPFSRAAEGDEQPERVSTEPTEQSNTSDASDAPQPAPAAPAAPEALAEPASTAAAQIDTAIEEFKRRLDESAAAEGPADPARDPAPDPAPNAAPVLDPLGAPSLTDVLEDATDPSGDTVADIVANGSITDADGAAVEAIVVTGAEEANGRWEYSLDDGSSWNAVGVVTDAAALPLDAAARLRFLPNADFNGTANLTYRAWDQTAGEVGVKLDVTGAGGESAFSAATATASATVVPVNDAPVLDTSGAPSLTAVSEDATNPAGDTVSELLYTVSITDADGAAATAIAVTGIDASNGAWEFSLDNGASWTDIVAAADANALLLDGDARLRFTPDPDFDGEAQLSFRAWDQSSGAVGGRADASVNGFTTGFSAASETATIDVTAVNDAPVLDTTFDPALTTIHSDGAAPAGDRVGDIIRNGSISDADADGAVEAIALTGTSGPDGVWEYSTDDGASWTAVGAVADDNALLLGSDAMLRFAPAPGVSGTATLSFRAWDKTTGVEGDKVDASTNGGTSAFSAQVETGALTVEVAPIANAAPVINDGGALSLSGSDSSVDAGDDYDLDNGDLTVEAWFYYDGVNGGAFDTRVIVSKGGTAMLEEGYSIFINNGNLVVHTATKDLPSAAQSAASHIALDGAGWRHVAMVIDQEPGDGNSLITGYLNGSNIGWSNGYGLVGDDAFTKSNTKNNESFLVGADTTFGATHDHFNGAVDDIRVWDKARSQAEIEADMTRELSGEESNLVGLWKFDEGGGDIAGNSVAGAPDGAVAGGAFYSGASATTAPETAVQGRVSASDADGDALSFSVEVQGANGTASIDADTGVWTYTPDSGFTGSDSVSYQVSDGMGGVDTVSITINVA